MTFLASPATVVNNYKKTEHFAHTQNTHDIKSDITVQSSLLLRRKKKDLLFFFFLRNVITQVVTEIPCF